MKKFRIFIFAFLLFLISHCLLLIVHLFASRFIGKDCMCQWVQQNLPLTTGYFHDMKFVNANTGFISNSTPVLIKTTNAGFNWQVLNDYNIYSISTVDSMYIYGAGYRNGYSKLYKSTNCGITWDSLLYTGASFCSVHFFNRDTGLISGFDGYYDVIWRTTNGGQTASLITSINWSSFTKFFFLKEKVNGEYYGLIYNGPAWYKTTNSGLSWQSMPNFPNFLSAKSMFFINQDTGWATLINISSFIIKTTNGGYSWSNQNMPFNGTCFDIYFANSRKGWIGTEATPKIYATSNSGINWGYQNLPGMGSYKLFFLDSNTGWAQTSWNILTHTTNGGGPITKITNNEEQIAREYVLEQNYPNPFNAMTKIKFSIPPLNPPLIKGGRGLPSGGVSLKVYDILGKEVSVLVNESALGGQPGTYEVTFEANSLSTGIYFYRIETDKFSAVKKMVLIK